MAQFVAKMTGKHNFALILWDYRDQAQWMSPIELADEILDDSRLSHGQKIRIIEILGL